MSGPAKAPPAPAPAAAAQNASAPEPCLPAAAAPLECAPAAAAEAKAAPAPGSSQRVLLFGGTFDPPHAGHMHSLAAAIRAVKPHRVIVMPAGIPPHKAASATPGEWRAAMCQCFVPLFPGLEVSDWEIRGEGKSYTIDTVRMLARRFAGAALYLCIGSDMLLSFTEWRCWRELLQRAALVVQSREREDGEALRAAAEALRAEGGRVLFTDAPALPMASSAIRAGGPGAPPLLPWVEQVARQHHLYGR